MFAILTFAIPLHLYAVELSTICSPNQPCEIKTSHSEVTNNAPFSTGNTNNNKIELKNAYITNFTNTSTIKTKEFSINGSYDDKSYIENFYNYGRIETSNTASLNTTTTGENGGYRNIYNYGYISGFVYLSQNESGTTHITNYGFMGGVVQNKTAGKEITIDNRGVINLFQEENNQSKKHFKTLKSLTIKNYAMKVSENASAFNVFSGNATDNSHLVLDSVQSVKFADKDSKLILDFGNDFEFGKGYLFDKLVVDTSGNNMLGVDFSRLTPKSDIYHITQQSDKFVVNLKPESSTIGNLYKSNVRTMNNFYTMSNSMIYPHKFAKKRVIKKRRVRRIKKTAESSLQGDYMESRPLSSLRENERSEFSWQSTDSIESLESLESHESFAYKSDSNNTNQTKRQSTNRRMSQTIPITQTDNNYHFILTPFLNHNYFFESGRYNLSGFEYGFLTAFSGKLTPSNSLGAHFMMSYGTLGDSTDKNFSITNLNLNVGLNYKFDMIWDMYLKARGDFFYFLNQVKTLTMPNAIKPNNLGFGVSVAYGKDFDFGNGGILGIEGGIDYKGLQSNTIELHDNTYNKSLYNLIYIDLGLNYNKYFNTNIGLWGINTTLGIKGNITANKLSKSQIHINNLNRDVNMVLDNDKVLGYANISGSYVLNHKDFDMEFSLAYYGNYGDRVMSNGGGFEWRVYW